MHKLSLLKVTDYYLILLCFVTFLTPYCVFPVEGVAYFQLRMGPIESCMNFLMVGDTVLVYCLIISYLILMFNYRMTLAMIMCVKD